MCWLRLRRAFLRLGNLVDVRTACRGAAYRALQAMRGLGAAKWQCYFTIIILIFRGDYCSSRCMPAEVCVPMNVDSNNQRRQDKLRRTGQARGNYREIQGASRCSAHARIEHTKCINLAPCKVFLCDFVRLTLIN